MSDYRNRFENCPKTLTLAQQVEQPLWAARTLVSLGIIHWRQGSYDQARSALPKAGPHHQRLGQRRPAYVHGSQLPGLITNEAGRYEQARQDYERALELSSLPRPGRR
ncbi:MAG: tetratricopeptide repeat protein [Anaerolineae bacterium]